MPKNHEGIGMEGLRFFGKVSASISHEIKNALAVIHENAGLMKDLILMSEKGRPLDLERINSLAERVSGQVRRADGIVNNLNRFAHSMDDSLKQIDLGEYLSFVTELSRRFADMRGVKLHYEHGPDPVNIVTSPFLLANLLYLCINYSVEAAEQGETVYMQTEPVFEGAQIRFRDLRIASMPGEKSPVEKGKELLDALEATLEADAGNRELVLTLQEKINTPF